MTKEAREGLKQSIEAYGLVQPIIWNSRSGNIVGGHQRYAELKSKGVQETDVIVVNLDIAHEKALNITLNNPKIAGDFDKSIIDLMKDIESDIGLEQFVNLKLDSLELEMKKQFNELDPNKEKKELSEVSDEDQEVSHVKQVQLFFDETTYPLFMELVGELKKKFMTDNPTDTVLEALKYAVEN